MSEIYTEERLLDLAHNDPKIIVESGFWVVNKEKQTVPFIFNTLQNEFYYERTTRDDILKPGQIGFSTMILSLLAVKFLLVPNSWSVCISHEDEATKRLFGKVDFFLQHLPDWLTPFLALETDSSHTLVNSRMNSRFYIGTAGARAFGRGDTVHYAHLSEVSRWKDQGRVAVNILRAVPIGDPHTWIVKETTANGQGNWHHLEYQREKLGQSEFKPHFPLWLKHEEYKIEGTIIDPSSLTEEEIHYKKRFPTLFTDERIAWRRKMIRTLTSESGRSPEEIFKQEFPFDDREAFLFSGNPVFPPQAIENYKDKTTPPLIKGNIVGVVPEQTIDESEQGWLQVWDVPEEDGQYVIFADVGQFSDFCVATVVDTKKWRVSAKFRANMQAHAFGTELYKLGHFYNKALIAVEVNNMGQSTLDRLVALSYPSLYMRERVNNKKDGSKEQKVMKVAGWMTTAKTKPLIIGFMQDLVRVEDVEIPDREILDEMSTFIRTASGGMEASEGNFDDQVISVCGAFWMCKLYPYREISFQKQVVVNRVRKFAKLRSGRLRNFRANH